MLPKLFVLVCVQHWNMEGAGEVSEQPTGELYSRF